MDGEAGDTEVVVKEGLDTVGIWNYGGVGAVGHRSQTTKRLAYYAVGIL